MRTTLQLAAVAMLGLVMAANARIFGSQSPDPADVAEGMRLYLRKGDCQSCHGWAADGRKMDSQMPDSPSLRETRLDRARIVTTIKCGRPGTGCRPSTSSRTATAAATA